ncbi:threonine synthase [Symbiobacterium terraclitae]|uniref:threonine synthase n=1 Tax=Symbiobacterium terraclitae TaxID=557451 RepID=UPI0035B4FB7B
MLTCSCCNQAYPETEPRWRCRCGAYLLLQSDRMFTRDALSGRPLTLWRYREALGIERDDSIVSLDEGFTPLVADTLFGQPVLLKLDQLNPTGSFKDRGSTVMISKLKEWGVPEIVEDSSGNAGASVAAYARRAGIAARIFVPASTSAGKTAQIRMYGADLVRVDGSREDTTRAALAAAGQTFYASHNWSPYFVAGLKTLAYEICEQQDWQAPDWVVAPVGGGSLVLGLYLGFADLVRAGIIARMPRIAAVQAAVCAPVCEAWQQRLHEVPEVDRQETAAEGIAIARPVKGESILKALYQSGGVALTVSEEEIWATAHLLAEKGIYVEPTSAAAPAAVRQLVEQGLAGTGSRVVVELTGMGLKATDKFLAHLGG